MIYFILQIVCITAYVGAVVSGIVPGGTNIIGWTSISFFGVIMIIFSRSYQKIFFISLLSLFLLALGAFPVWHFFLTLTAALLCGNIFFAYVLKNHAPVADTMLIGIVFFLFLFFQEIFYLIGEKYGIYHAILVFYSLMQSAELILMILPVVLGVLIVWSNYSKYGSLITV